MHSAALALNWQIWGRHRWGLAGAMLIVAMICAVPHAYSVAELASESGVHRVPFILPLMLPFSFVIFYLAYVFSLAELGTHARTSGFPFWMLTLPVRTPWLVFWPMASAAATVALVWLTVGWFALNKIGLEVPLIWPALGLACTLIWIQALDWSPLGSLSKVLAACTVLATLWTGLLRDDTHAATLAAIPVFLLLGFVAGCAGVSRLRRGARSVALPTTLAPVLQWRIGREQKFANAHQAQFWLEWRRNGSFLPLAASCWVGLCMIAGHRGDVGPMHASVQIWLLLAPITGLILGKSDVWSRQVRLPVFVASRPLTCGDIFVAKMRALALGNLAACVILVSIWLAWGRTYADLWKAAQYISPERHWFKPCLALVATFLGFVSFNMFLLAGSSVVSLTGRYWIAMVTLFAYVSIPALLTIKVTKIFNAYLVELATVGLAVKLLLAAWAFRYCYRRGMITGSAITGLVSAWFLTVASTFLAFYLLEMARRDDMTVATIRDVILVIALLCPLLRIALGPVALAWNRHR